MNARFWTWDVFDNFTWDHGATVLAAAIGALGGILLAIAGTLPVSPYITTISFVIYLVCRGVGSRRKANSGRVLAG